MNAEVLIIGAGAAGLAAARRLAGCSVRVEVIEALFVVAGAVVLLIFISIHNAWDIVTYLATGQADI